MRIDIDPRLPQPSDRASYPSDLNARLYKVFKDLITQLNGISEGKASAVTNASVSAPTTGTWAKGDFIKNSSPIEAGTAGNKYVIAGWICTVGGTPGTWLSCRFLTGN